jgi:hypothetical protein
MAVIFLKFIFSVRSGHCDYFHPDANRPSYATASKVDKCEIWRHAYVAYVSVMETVVQLLRNTVAVSRSQCSTLKCISEYTEL